MNALRRARHDERGIGMVTALGVTFVVFAAAGMWFGVAEHQITGSALERDREKAYAAAEAGLNVAMAKLAKDATNCAPFAGTVDGAEYEVEFDPFLDCSAEDETQRYIVARGYAPSKSAARPQTRQLEQLVTLDPEQGFKFALFAAPGGITAGSNMTINGDIFATEDLNLANSSKVFGDVVGLRSVTVNNNSVVSGTVHAVGDISLTASGATVGGNVWSAGDTNPDGTPYGGNIHVNGWVKGNAQAARNITLGSSGKIDGEVTPNSPPPAPRSQTLPEFDPNAYTYVRVDYDASTWKNEVWLPSASPTFAGITGHYRLEGTPGALSLDKRWAMSGDVIVVSDGPLDLSRDIVNQTSGDVTLGFISFDSSTTAISMTNNLSLPQDIKILFFAPNGCVNFRNLKHFTGTVYARCIIMDNQFTLTFHPIEVPGFTWTVTSAGDFEVQARTFREVRFTAPMSPSL